MRYRLLETLRHYARQKLEASGALHIVRQQHAAYYLRLAETAEPELRGPQLPQWLERLASEHENLRAALQWTIDEGERERSLRLAGALWPYWEVRGLWTEGRGILAALLPPSAARTDPPTPSLA